MKENINGNLLYDALKQYDPDGAISALDDDAASRLGQELRLFEERGWRTYILFLADFLKRLDEREMLFFSGSAAGSLLLDRLADPSCDVRKPFPPLADGALRLCVEVVRPDAALLTKSVEKLDKALEAALAAHPLQCRQKMVSAPADLNGACNLLVLSNDAIPDADLDRIARGCRGGEADLPKQYLIVTVKTKRGI